MKYFILYYIKAPQGESGEPCKSIYNFDRACKACGTGVVLEGKLRTKGLKKINKDFFITQDDDFIISEKLYESLRKEKIKLGDLKNIVDNKNNDLPFYHLNTTLTLPPAIKKEGFTIEGQCPVCKRNGYFCTAIIGPPNTNIPTKILPYDLHYSLSNMDILSQSDFLFTWESMGLSNLVEQGNNVIRYARPLLVVSEDFKSTLEKLKVLGLKFEQIVIDN